LDAAAVAAVVPAALEAGAVVGEDAFDRDPVGGVEGAALVEEGERGVGCLVRVDLWAKPSRLASSMAA
jgi:hypothetical protein